MPLDREDLELLRLLAEGALLGAVARRLRTSGTDGPAAGPQHLQPAGR